jgi:hypothetical protein
MLSVNSVLVSAEEDVEPAFKTNMLVVYIDKQSKLVCLLPLDKKRPRKPKSYPFEKITALVETGAVNTAKLDFPKYHLLDDSSIKTSRIVRRDKRYEIISPILNDIHSYMFPRHRHSIVAQVAKKLGIQSIVVVRIMNMWFYGGQSKNALLGDYSQVGINSPGEKAQKVGAKRKNSQFIGKAITEQDKAKIGRSLTKNILVRNAEVQKSLQGAYDEMLRLEYSTTLVAPNGRKTIEIWSDNDIPSYNQYYHHAWKYFREKGKNPDQYKVTPTVYQKDYAARTGNITRIDRPGEQYQIDETPLDVAIIADPFSKTASCVGRATLYLVCDVATNVIVGIYLTINPPSWEGMRQALLNAFLPKVEFCQRFGINIEKEDWPYGVCGELLGDNAELQASMSEVLEQQFNCSVRLTRAGRGDDKGLVEGTFSAFMRDLKGKIPGIVFANQKDKGLTESRYRACLTINELYKILINLILYRNKYLELSYDKLDHDMIQDCVIPRPLQLWKWGCSNGGAPRIYPREYIEARLKSKGMASVRKNGVYFQGLWYTCEWTLEANLQNRKPAGHKSPRVICLFDRNTVDTITLSIDGKSYPAYLQEKSRRFANRTFDEVELEFNSEKSAVNQRAPEARSAKATLNSEISDIVTSAQEKAPKLIKAERRRQNIRTNRQIEAAKETALLGETANKSNKKLRPTEQITAKNRSTAHDAAPNKSHKNISQALDSLISGDDDD